MYRGLGADAGAHAGTHLVRRIQKDVIAVARIAGIQAARRCADLIPLRHPLMLAGIAVDLELDKPGSRVPILTAGRLNGQRARQWRP
jgi:molybdenum cofactor biosynthesis enzyme